MPDDAPPLPDVETISLVGLDGRPFLDASVPRIERRFRSQLHTVDNLTVRLGHWQGELELLLGRRAPTARLVTNESHLGGDADTRDREALTAAVRRALAEGFIGGYVLDVEGVPQGWLATPTPIAETIDVDALRADYPAWFDAAGVLDVVPERRLGRRHRQTSPRLRHRRPQRAEL
jgi:hypothetical protein